MKNPGKIFEDAAKNSMPERCMVVRLPDPPQSFTKRSDTSFSRKNPYDYIVVDSKTHIVYCLEMKTTKNTSMSFDDPYGKEPESKMVKRHQILSLKKAAEFDGIYPAFVFNFREIGEDNEQRTYVMHIDKFIEMLDNINGKKSFNMADIILNGGLKIDGFKKRTRYSWDFESFFDSQSI